MKVDQIATKAMRYGGRALQPGDTFEASRRDARLLRAIGKAKDASEAREEPEPEEVDEGDRGRDGGRRGKPRGGSYQRRDLRAED